jgi:hypothetical protein
MIRPDRVLEENHRTYNTLERALGSAEEGRCALTALKADIHEYGFEQLNN